MSYTYGNMTELSVLISCKELQAIMNTVFSSTMIVTAALSLSLARVTPPLLDTLAFSV
jgi:hypothetical protein